MNNARNRILSLFPYRSRWATLRRLRPFPLGTTPLPVPPLNARTVALVAALMGPVALLIPWLSLDGHTASLSGTDLMAYAFHGNDRLVMWRISPLATAALLVLPFAITAGVSMTAVNVLRRDHRLDAPVFTVAAVLLLLRFTPPVLASQTHVVGQFAMPGWGLALLLAATLTVIAMSAAGRLAQQRAPTQSSP